MPQVRASKGAFREDVATWLGMVTLAGAVGYWVWTFADVLFAPAPVVTLQDCFEAERALPADRPITDLDAQCQEVIRAYRIGRSR